ncbi:MAG: DUF5618 family protein [Prevotellaceae bacterium]|jgi:uncharacterized protein (UPF0332 family)|nr:DUF5618 family protein [Prevotellaceae bacterium]
MSLKEQQQEVKSKAYAEAIRYMDNAKETLKKAGKEDGRYGDVKYVRTACGTAYNGVLMAMDAYLFLKGVEQKKGRKSIEYYTSNISNLDKKLLSDVKDVYSILHLSGYYDGIHDAMLVKRGFDMAYQIIDKIKPDYLPEQSTLGKLSLLKRLYSFFFLNKNAISQLLQVV